MEEHVKQVRSDEVLGERGLEPVSDRIIPVAPARLTPEEERRNDQIARREWKWTEQDSDFGVRSPAPAGVVVGARDLWVLLLSAVRYGLGRGGYAPGRCAEMYARYRAALDADQRAQLAGEIKAKIDQHDDVLPFPCVRDWLRLVADLLADGHSL
jgi:hypothetical protein